MNLLYLGPGLGGGVLIIIIGVLALVIITIFTFLWFPIKRFIKRMKNDMGNSFGIIISIVTYYLFVILNCSKSINNWIIETAKFIYYSGHPVFNDEEIFSLITRKFKKVALLFGQVIIKILAIILILLAALVLGVYLLPAINENTKPAFLSAEFIGYTEDYLLQWPFIIGSLLPILLILALAKKTKKDGNPYSPIEKLLHYVFLGNAAIARLLFKIEMVRNKKALKSSALSKNVYISGLARSGTTALTQYLAQLPGFASLSYRNLPFLFLPKTWPRLFSEKKNLTTERSHKDGIIHNLDSSEALEEPFGDTIWEKYITEDSLLSHTIDGDTYVKYNSFRRLAAGDKIYLAKNNNHLLRASSLHCLDTESGNKTITFITFREPYAHATSLLNQHYNLSQLQQQDDFTPDYMDFLVHHEFGLNHKITNLGMEKYERTINTDMTSLEYWLDVWYSFYEEAISMYGNKTGFYFFCFDWFCKKPFESISKITSLVEVSKNDFDRLSIKEFTPRKSVEVNDPNNKYLLLYKELLGKAINNEN